jgi:hypothetical protein
MTEPRNRKTVTRTYTNIDQTDKNMDFDGMINKALPKQTNRLAGNHSGLTGITNAGRGPTKGNQDHAAKKIGPPATADAYRAAPTDALPSNTKIKNPDYINGGAQVRTPGGTRPFDPKMGQNYNGNPDRINVGNTGGRKKETFLK